MNSRLTTTQFDPRERTEQDPFNRIDIQDAGSEETMNQNSVQEEHDEAEESFFDDNDGD